jgi:uncharacterized membrane protein YhaH (DUF805 family)
VQFLKSLFCLQGFDNRPRFFAIFSAVHVLFIMLASAFIGNYLISITILLLFSVVLALTSLRRLHDAKLNKNWLLAPSLVFLIIAFIVVFSEQSSSYYLLIIPALCSALLLTYPSTNKLNFILGYSGPVDMNKYQQETHQGKHTRFRIEPTLVNENSEGFDNNVQSVMQSQNIGAESVYQNHEPVSKQADIGEMIRLTLLSNKKAQLILAAIVGLTLIGVASSWVVKYLNSDNETGLENTVNQQASTASKNISRSNPLSMPDNYTLYLSEHQGISINWQADEVATAVLWSQLTTQGDESCKEISFNKGEPIRTLSVHVESADGLNTNYFANFSPLDSKTLIQALAFRGNFSLCGYNFSLKGSQAALGGNPQYSQWVDY